MVCLKKKEKNGKKNKKEGSAAIAKERLLNIVSSRK